MKATPDYPRASTAQGTVNSTGLQKPVTAVDTANSSMESARDLSQRVVSLAQLLAGFAPPPDSDTAEGGSSNVFGRLRANALDANSAIALAHEALDFIEGQIS